MSLTDILAVISPDLELPETAYEKAANRYEDLGTWLTQSTLAKYNPHIFPQGSFRLGTGIRPIVQADEYDLDLACELRTGISKSAITQEQLRQMLRTELENYRVAKNISSPVETKRRCLRLNYRDALSFHMDIVPCLPASTEHRQYLAEAVQASILDKILAIKVANLTVEITDDERPEYRTINNDWQLSNPEGYARWFESRIRIEQERILLEEATKRNKARIEDLPTYQWKTPLQRAIQILKRHRDVMFADQPDSKPISIIITTLAAAIYSGEGNVATAIKNILRHMIGAVATNVPRIPNPVNPKEDFTDKWRTPEGKKLGLETNFLLWVKQAMADFEVISANKNVKVLSEQLNTKFNLSISDVRLREKVASLTSGANPASVFVIDKAEQNVQPWCITL